MNLVMRISKIISEGQTGVDCASVGLSTKCLFVAVLIAADGLASKLLEGVLFLYNQVSPQNKGV